MLRTKARGGSRRAERFPRISGICGLLVLVAGCSSAADDGGEGDDGKKNGAGPVVSSFADAQVYVDAHNAVRAAVKEPAGYSGSWQSVPPVAWSDEVATTALAWAKHLRDTKDCGLEHAAGSGYGENLAAGTNVDAERAVDMWASEIDDYSYSPEYAFENDTGHYTQIVWRGTEHIGCASAACSGSNVVVCRYDPPGNYLGQKIY